MLVTTSSGSSRKTRKFGLKFAGVMPFGRYRGRGKAGLERIIGIARKLGKERVCVVEEKAGRPESLNFIEVDEPGWKWIDPSVKILEYSGKTSEEICRRLEVRGDKAETWVSLVGELGNQLEESWVLVADGNSISVSDEEMLLSMSVEYESRA